MYRYKQHVDAVIQLENDGDWTVAFRGWRSLYYALAIASCVARGQTRAEPERDVTCNRLDDATTKSNYSSSSSHAHDDDVDLHQSYSSRHHFRRLQTAAAAPSRVSWAADNAVEMTEDRAASGAVSRRRSAQSGPTQVQSNRVEPQPWSSRAGLVDHQRHAPANHRVPHYHQPVCHVPTPTTGVYMTKRRRPVGAKKSVLPNIRCTLNTVNQRFSICLLAERSKRRHVPGFSLSMRY